MLPKVKFYILKDNFVNIVTIYSLLENTRMKGKKLNYKPFTVVLTFISLPVVFSREF